ncbi:MAG TPA: AMP-binding protein [Acidimicrobiales bacterium]|nr:AMP-binding protein [Acidimicrobiales bacterium]
MANLTSDDISREVAGRTVPTLFAATVAERADATALRWQITTEAWDGWTWAQYADRACRFAASLAQLGIGRGDRIVLMIRNRAEFHVADMGALLVGATPVSIYNSSAPDQVRYLAGHCDAKLAVVEDLAFLERIIKVRADLPELRHVVVIDDPHELAEAGTHRWVDLLGAGPVDLESAAHVASPDDLATIVYTSGTTGPPKGAMLTHANLAWLDASGTKVMPIDLPGARFISYLPMAHVLERLLSHYMHVGHGTEVTTCPDPGLLAAYLGQVRPTVFVGVPRVWEKLYAGIWAMAGADPERAADFGRAVAAGKARERARVEGRELTDDERAAWERAEAEAFSLVRMLVGLDECQIAVTGAAPIAPETFDFFRALGIPLSEGYGMTESSGVITNEYVDPRPGSVGRALPGVELRIADDGEVLARGGNVFPGYLHDPEKTAETVDDEGWLHTGDVGTLDDEGYLRIVDRKKELIITAGGKNISPANIEAALKEHPLIGQVAVIGDNRPFLSALVVLDPDVSPGWAASHGIEDTDLAALAAHPEVRAELDRFVAEANARFSRVEQIKRYTILGEEWQPDSVELTPTMKLKRRGIAEKYADHITELYT